MRARQRTVDFPLGQLKAYFSDNVWNRIDLVYNVLMLACLALRLTSASIPSGSSTHLQARVLETSRCLLAVAICVLYLRLLGALTIFPSVGELTSIFLSMVQDSAPFFAMLAVFALGFGVAYTALLPYDSPDLFGDPRWAERSWARPLWTLVGYIYTPDAVQSEEEPEIVRVLMPILLFLYSFVVGVMTINLMIAQISTSFADLKVSALSDREQP